MLMPELDTPPDAARRAITLPQLTRYTLVAAALAACMAEEPVQ
jgi:hypothetical protein